MMYVMSNIPTHEPASLIAGDTAKWLKSLADYPAIEGWSLEYQLINKNHKITIAATAQGSDFLINVAASVTAAWQADEYAYRAQVSKAGEVYTVSSGTIIIKPSFNVNNLDTHTPARKIYETLLAAYQTASVERAFVQEYEIAGRRMKFMNMTDWIKAIEYWKAQVVLEARTEKLTNGLSGGFGNKLLVRFNNG